MPCVQVRLRGRFARPTHALERQHAQAVLRVDLGTLSPAENVAAVHAQTPESSRRRRSTLRDKVHGLLVGKPLQDRTAALRWLQNSLRRISTVRAWIEEVHDNARTIAEAAAQRGLLVRTSSTRRSADSLACAVAASAGAGAALQDNTSPVSSCNNSAEDGDDEAFEEMEQRRHRGQTDQTP